MSDANADRLEARFQDLNSENSLRFLPDASTTSEVQEAELEARKARILELTRATSGSTAAGGFGEGDYHDIPEVIARVIQECDDWDSVDGTTVTSERSRADILELINAWQDGNRRLMEEVVVLLQQQKEQLTDVSNQPSTTQESSHQGERSRESSDPPAFGTTATPNTAPSCSSEDPPVLPATREENYSTIIASNHVEKKKCPDPPTRTEDTEQPTIAKGSHNDPSEDSMVHALVEQVLQMYSAKKPTNSTGPPTEENPMVQAIVKHVLKKLTEEKDKSPATADEKPAAKAADVAPGSGTDQTIEASTLQKTEDVPDREAMKVLVEDAKQKMQCNDYIIERLSSPLLSKEQKAPPKDIPELKDPPKSLSSDEKRSAADPPDQSDAVNEFTSKNDPTVQTQIGVGNKGFTSGLASRPGAYRAREPSGGTSAAEPSGERSNTEQNETHVAQPNDPRAGRPGDSARETSNITESNDGLGLEAAVTWSRAFEARKETGATRAARTSELVSDDAPRAASIEDAQVERIPIAEPIESYVAEHIKSEEAIKSQEATTTEALRMEAQQQDNLFKLLKQRKELEQLGYTLVELNQYFPLPPKKRSTSSVSDDSEDRKPPASNSLVKTGQTENLELDDCVTDSDAEDKKPTAFPDRTIRLSRGPFASLVSSSPMSSLLLSTSALTPMIPKEEEQAHSHQQAEQVYSHAATEHLSDLREFF